MNAMADGPLAPLERYLDATDVPSPPDLADRIGARLLFEPRSTAPRRFLAALRARDPRGIARGLGQNVATAFRPGTRSMLLRAQATAVVLVAVASIGLGSVAGLAATQRVVRELDPWSPSVTRATDPGVDAPAIFVASPREEQGAGGIPERTGTPTDARQPGLAQAPGQACGRSRDEGSGPGVGPDDERCPEPPALGRGRDGERGPAVRGASDKARGDRAAARRSDKAGADHAAAGRKGDRPAGRPDDPGSARASKAKTRASDPGKAGAAASKKTASKKKDKVRRDRE